MSATGRTITATLTDEQYADLQIAAEESASDSHAMEAMEVLVAAWEASALAAQAEAVRYGAHHERDPGGTPGIKITVSAEVTGEWVEPMVIADTTRQLVASLTHRLGQAADTVPVAWQPMTDPRSDGATR